MIYAFAGEDIYESYNKAKAALEKIAAKQNATYEIMNADEVYDINLFLQKIEGVSMFSSASIIFAKRIFDNKKLIEYIAENYDNLKQYDIILWHDRKIDSKLKLAKALAKDKVIFNYELPKDREMKNWIIQEAKAESIALTLSQVDFLYERIGSDKFSVKNEFNKFKVFLNAKNKTKLSEDEMNDLLGFNIKGDMWKFLDAVGSRNKKSALNEFIKLTAYENNTQLLLAMLDREFRMISQVHYARKNNIDTKSLGINPFVLQKTLQKAVKFSFKEIKFFLKKLFDLDIAIKRGEIEENIGMSLLLASL